MVKNINSGNSFKEQPNTETRPESRVSKEPIEDAMEVTLEGKLSEMDAESDE